MATPDNGLVAMLYNSCEVTAKVGDGSMVSVKEQTHYPFEEKVSIAVSASGNQFPLYFRIPAWCNHAQVLINGKLLQADARAGTYLRIERKWNKKDVVELLLPMQVQVKHWEQNQNSVSMYYGPLSFSLKIKEDYRKVDSKASAIGDSKWQQGVDTAAWPSFEIYPASKWNYGLVLTGSRENALFTVIKKPWPKDGFPFTLEGVPMEIKITGKEIPSWKTDQYGLCGLLPKSPVKVNTPIEKLTLIPMGAARLRISSFPIIH